MTDGREARVYWISPRGEILSRVGRPGEGPGEFRRITAVTAIGAERVAVADVMRRVEEFGGSDSLRYSRTLPLAFSPTSMCSIGREVFAYASPGGIDSMLPIRVLDDEWVELRQFGEIYKSPNPMINNAMGEVQLLCAGAVGRLIVVPRAGLGEVYILTIEGEPMHRIVWTDYLSMDIIESADGGFSATLGPQGMNRFRGGSIIDDSLAILQFDYLSKEDFADRDDFTTLQSVVINLLSGEIVARSRSWPALTVLPGGGAVVAATDGWPGVTLHPRSETN